MHKLPCDRRAQRALDASWEERRALPRRVAKYAREATGWSRRAIERAHAEGRLRLAPLGQSPRPCALRELIYPGADLLLVDGAQRAQRAPRVLAMLHKPRGVITTRSDPAGRPSVAPWLDALPSRHAFPVGRLDRDTSGALLLTDDGDLARLLLHPDSHLTKRYLLRLAPGGLDLAAGLAAIERGVELGDGRRPARAVGARLCGRGPFGAIVRLDMDEGRKRQIRRMCRACGLKLRALHRAQIGPERLGALPPGALRALGASAWLALYEAAGGSDRVVERTRAALARQARLARERREPDERLEAWLADPLATRRP